MPANMYQRFFDQQASNMPYTEWSALDTRQRGMTICKRELFMHRNTQTSMATYSKQLVRTTNDMCVVMYEAAKSHLYTCILSGMLYSHIHTERLYMGIFSAIYRRLRTGKTSHKYTTACSPRHVNHLAIH